MYSLKITSNTEEYIKLDGDFSSLEQAVYRGEMQFLDAKKMTADISLEGGLEIPDILAQGNLVFISFKFKEMLEKLSIDYLFYKEVTVKDERLSIYERFFLLIAPKIDCISLDSLPQEGELWDYHDGLIPFIDPCSHPRDSNHFKIDENLLGRYEVFRVFGMCSNTIYITDRLKEKLNAAQLEGLTFLAVP